MTGHGGDWYTLCLRKMAKNVIWSYKELSRPSHDSKENIIMYNTFVQLSKGVHISSLVFQLWHFRVLSID